MITPYFVLSVALTAALLAAQPPSGGDDDWRFLERSGPSRAAWEVFRPPDGRVSGPVLSLPS